MAQAMTVTVGPLATADADGICASQKAAAAQALAINGALTDGQAANNICQSQSPGGAGNLTLNGSLVSAGVANLGVPRPVYITSAGNDSSRTFTVYGTTYNAAGGPISVVETVTGANASVVATTKSFWTVTRIAISGASASTVTVGRGGLATLDTARRVLITSGGNDTGITFTITGTDANGNAVGEAVTGASAGTATSALDYKAVTSIVTSGAVATVVEIGTSGVASSPWVRFDDLAGNAQVAIQCTVSGSVNYTVQQTVEDPNVITNNVPPNTHQWSPSSITWVDHPDTALSNASATAQGNYAFTPTFAKVVLNSGTGSVTATFRQVFLG